MEIEQAIRAYLLTKTALTALISSRILPDEVSDGVDLPTVTYQKISDNKMHMLSGQSNLEAPMYQYTVYATTKAAAVTIKNLLKSALDDYAGTLSGLVVQKIELVNELSSRESSTDGTIKVYTEDLEYKIFYERS